MASTSQTWRGASREVSGEASAGFCTIFAFENPDDFFFLIFNFIYLFIFVFCLFRAIPTAYGGSQARGLIGAVALGLCQSHSNARSEPCLQPTPQLTATLDSKPAERGQGSNPQPPGS